MRTKLKTAQEIAQWMVSIYRDAIAFHYTHDVLMAQFQRVYESRDYKRLTRIDKAYVTGYERCYHSTVIERQYTESGSWVTMPDGTVEYFGLRERLGQSNAKLDALYPQLAEYGIHRYIHEHQIPGRSGIYWVNDGKWDGQYPHFIPEIHSKR